MESQTNLKSPRFRIPVRKGFLGNELGTGGSFDILKSLVFFKCPLTTTFYMYYTFIRTAYIQELRGKYKAYLQYTVPRFAASRHWRDFQASWQFHTNLTMIILTF